MLCMPFLTQFLLFWKPDPTFVCGVICIKENNVAKAQGYLLVFIDYYFFEVRQNKNVLMHIYKRFTLVYICAHDPIVIEKNSKGESNDSKVIYKIR